MSDKENKHMDHENHTHSEHDIHDHHNHNEHENHSHPDYSEHEGNDHHVHMNHEGHDHGGHEGHEGHSHHDHHAHMADDMMKRFWVVLVVSIPIAMLSPMLMEIFNYSFDFTGKSIVEFVLATIVFFYGGKPFIEGAVDELKDKQPSMMSLITLGITTSYVYSAIDNLFLGGEMNYYFELATLVLVMLLGHVLGMRAEMRATDDLSSLAKLLPDEANLIDEDGNITTVKVSELNTDDQILVRPGDKVPVDGVIVEGTSSIDESAISGESVPVNKSADDEVIGGSINGDGSLTVTVKATGSESYLNQMITLVQNAQKEKSKTQGQAEKVASWLFYAAIIVGLIALFIWWYLETFGYGINFMVSVFVIACPHALGLAVPLVNSRSTSLAARSGLLIQHRIPFEDAYKVDAVVFDKTGTLTEGKFGVDNVHAYSESYSEADVFQITYSLENRSEHPIAKGIVREAEERDITSLSVSDFENISGAGLKGLVDGKEVEILSPGATRKNGHSFDEADFEDQASNGRTVVFIIVDGELIGSVSVSDIIRESAKRVVEELHSYGIESVMMTGDNQQVADSVAKEIGIDQVFAEVLPDEKSENVKQLQNDGKRVMMVGDGVNDAPALSQAEVGVAIGAGTDVAIDSADIILVDSDVKDVLNIVRLSKATSSKITQNLWFGAGYNIIAIPLAAGLLQPLGIVLSPAVSGILMGVSMVVTALNAMTLSYDRID